MFFVSLFFDGKKFNMIAIETWYIINKISIGSNSQEVQYHVLKCSDIVSCRSSLYCHQSLLLHIWYLWCLSNACKPAERRSQGYQLEFLFNYYIKMLQRHQRQSSLMKVWESILHGLQIYPFSPELLKDVVEVGHYYTTSNKLRRILDDCCYKYVPCPYGFWFYFKMSWFDLTEISRQNNNGRV